MGYITQRIYQFRGINRSLQPNDIDMSYAYDAVNVELIGGKLSNAHVGSERAVTTADVPAARLIFDEYNEVLIAGKKYFYLRDSDTGRYNFEPYDPNDRPLLDVVNEENDLYLNGYGFNNLQTKINDVRVIIASGMFTETDNTSRDFGDRVYDRGHTALYYCRGLDADNVPIIGVRKFGSGQFMVYDMSVDSTETDASTGYVTSVTVDKLYSELTQEQKDRAKLDGLWFFSEAIGATVEEDDVEKAYMWMEVTDVISGTGGKAKFTVNTTRPSSDITAGSYTAIRGQCSDIPVTYMKMFMGRLFATAMRPDNSSDPTYNGRRLYWSCLPGDGRSIEDWTQTDVSVDTSGGHVDVGDDTDRYITGLEVCGSQLLIFTATKLWRLYGSAPSNFRIELVGYLSGEMLSNPVEHNGTVYWLTIEGLFMYNGSYISQVGASVTFKNMFSSMAAELDKTKVETTFIANMFNHSLLFAYNARLSEPQDNAFTFRYDLNSGEITKYKVPCNVFVQQTITKIPARYDDIVTLGGVKIVNGTAHETRYFQCLCYLTNPLTQTENMIITQIREEDYQSHGWYDSKAVESKWETGWTDMQSPESDKKVNDICVRGRGYFDLTIESEINTERSSVTMPETNRKVRDIAPRHAEGRCFHMTVESEEQFEIEPCMTIKFETGANR